jgi:transposase
MSGDRTPLRFDVVAGTRRSWSREQKAAIVAEVGVSGASVSQVARRHGLNAGLLFRWRREFQSGPGTPQRKAGNGTPSVPAFVPIMLPAPEAPAPAKPGIVEIVIAGGRTVRVSTDVDTAALVRIVAALENGR